MDNNTSINPYADIDHKITISILAFTIGGFCISCFLLVRTIFKSTYDTGPRNISDLEANLLAQKVKIELDKIEGQHTKLSGVVTHDRD